MARIRVNFSYDPAKDTVVFNPAKLFLSKGDELDFHSPQGPVHIKLEPAAMFSAVEYKSGAAAVKVQAAGRWKIRCGVKIGDSVVGWPLDERFGPQNPNEPPDDGRGGGGGGTPGGGGGG